MRLTIAILLCVSLFACGVMAQDSQDTQETITVTKFQFDLLNEKVEQMQQELDELKAGQQSDSILQTEPADTQANEGGRHLALPDISLIVQAKGKLTDDKNDPDRQKILLSEAELGIQGYVYPNVKADAFFTSSPAEDEPFGVEEAYLTYLGIGKGLNFNVGKKHVAFGRTNLLHCHSWLYTRQPTVISNFVSPESLTGQGMSVSYVIPTNLNLFAQLDLGAWANGSEGEPSDLPDIVTGPGANMTNRFSTARLWTSYPTSVNSELELGGSWAGGKSSEDPVTLETDYVHLRGIDISYRHFGQGTNRTLLRSEYFWRSGTTDSSDATAKGYYIFGNYRWNKYGSIGLLYDWNEFPQAVDMHESSVSLILTKQFSEQYYVRLQAIHGCRPDCDSYNECWLQWVWGVGPHTHNLE
ncbi:hypothetical protein LLG46_01540 [bacterium]|nr:hypothetical protein [bacterium]